MSRLLNKLTMMSVVAMMLTGTVPVAAQSTPQGQNAIDPAVRAELAATVLTADDLPVGYAFVGESFLTAGQLASAGASDAAALTDAGFLTAYVTVYKHADSGMSIRSYVSAWTDDAAAEAGFTLLEDESAAEGMTDEAIEIGQEPRELSTGTYKVADGSTVGTADITFRSGDRLAGVAVETIDGLPTDTGLASDLANRLSERAEAVQKGEAPANTDFALPGRMISLASQGTEVQAGFLGPSEVESIYGVQGSVLASVKVSWVEAVVLGENAAGPLVSIGLTSFEAPENATASVEQSADIFAPLKDQQAVEGASLEGTNAIQAYRYSSSTDETSALDSYRIVYAAGTDLVVIDVQGAPSDAIATDAANQLAAAQLACQNGEACTVPELTAELTGQ
jgi:hypothetical protein